MVPYWLLHLVATVANRDTQNVCRIERIGEAKTERFGAQLFSGAWTSSSHFSLIQAKSPWPFSWISGSWVKPIQTAGPLTARWLSRPSITSLPPTSSTETARWGNCTTSRSPQQPSRYFLKREVSELKVTRALTFTFCSDQTSQCYIGYYENSH